MQFFEYEWECNNCKKDFATKTSDVSYCPYCGSKEIHLTGRNIKEVGTGYTPKIETIQTDYEIPTLEYSPSLESILHCGPYKEIHLSCGHIIRCEFAQFRKGEKTWCNRCKKDVEVVKCVDTVTGEEHDIL